jgi:hypothetical protein
MNPTTKSNAGLGEKPKTNSSQAQIALKAIGINFQALLFIRVRLQFFILQPMSYLS